MFFNAIRDQRAEPGMPTQGELEAILANLTHPEVKYPWVTRIFDNQTVSAGFKFRDRSYECTIRLCPTPKETVELLNSTLSAWLDREVQKSST
jgi:hypothetical protein